MADDKEMKPLANYKLPENKNAVSEIKRSLEQKKRIAFNSNSNEKKLKIKTQQISPVQVSREEREIALDFASKVHKKFDSMIKATVLFGSQATHTATSSSDIDIIILIDDAAIAWDLELIAWYREELGKLIRAGKYDRELHINTIRLTTWWQDLLYGDPVVINILRYGEALIDSGGFFNPQKVLLLQGKIRATPESIYTMLQRSPAHLARSKIAVLSAIEGVYWTMVDAAQAALTTLGKLPPSPDHIADMLRDNFVANKMLKPSHVDWYRDIYTLHKGITYGQLREIKGAAIDVWHERAEEFLSKMTEIIDTLIEEKRK